MKVGQVVSESVSALLFASYCCDNRSTIFSLFFFPFPLFLGAASPSKDSNVHAYMQTDCKSWCAEILKAFMTQKHPNLLWRVREKMGDHSSIHVGLFNNVWICRCIFQSILRPMCLCFTILSGKFCKPSKTHISCFIEKVWCIATSESSNGLIIYIQQ